MNSLSSQLLTFLAYKWVLHISIFEICCFRHTYIYIICVYIDIHLYIYIYRYMTEVFATVMKRHTRCSNTLTSSCQLTQRLFPAKPRQLDSQLVLLLKPFRLFSPSSAAPPPPHAASHLFDSPFSLFLSLRSNLCDQSSR